VGFWLGTSNGEDVWVPVERPISLIGATRAGKGWHFVIPFLTEYPGSIITTSTRPDNMIASAVCRAAWGPIYCFNPDGVGGYPHNVNWSAIEGCEIPKVARKRAATLVGASGLGGDNKDGVWATASGGILQALLHAAAVEGLTIEDVYRWSRNIQSAEQAINILLAGAQRRDDPLMDQWHLTLTAVQALEGRMQDSKWLGVEQALAPLHEYKVRRHFAHKPSDPGYFNTREFILNGGTVYMIANGSDSTDDTAGTAGVFYSLFLDHVNDVTREVSQRNPDGRLVIPQGLLLDELANIYAWKAAGRVMSAGAGEGVQEVAIFQTYEQSVDAYTRERAGVIRDNSMTILLGNSKNAEYLQGIADLMPTRTVTETSRQVGGGLPLLGSTTHSTREVPGLTADEIRRLPFGTAAILETSTRLMIVDLVRYHHRAHANCIKASRAWHAAHPGQLLTSTVVPKGTTQWPLP